MRERQSLSTIQSGFSDKKEYNLHARMVREIGNLQMGFEFRPFEIDEQNNRVLKFLLLYFNRSQEAENVFPEENYKLHKNILLIGEVGTGKTMIMQVFSDYLKRTKNPMQFHNLSVTQMTNYYKIHNHLDKYTYNEDGSKSFEGNPFNICLNDIGLESHKHYGTDTKILTDDFLHARNEIWTAQRKFAHITTNLSIPQIKERFNDRYGRLIDRFKTYNVISLTGTSRR